MRNTLTLLLAALLVLLCGCSSTSDAAAPLTITFVKVGKADGMVLQTEHHTVVIDCGEKSDGDKMVDCLAGVETVDYLILTHFDQDHIGGAAKVLKNFTVQHVIAADYTEDSSEYEKLVQAMQAQNLQFETPDAPLTFSLDDADFTVYPHEAGSYAEGADNNRSLVTKLTHHGNVFLFTGDAMQERLDEIMDIGDCTLLKVPYHGRELANLPEFLDAVTPEYAVISTSAKELSFQTIQALEQRNIKTYATCLDGSIRVVSDGKGIEIGVLD